VGEILGRRPAAPPRAHGAGRESLRFITTAPKDCASSTSVIAGPPRR